MSEIFGADLWRGIADDLRGEAERWWKDNQEAIIELGKEEAKDIFASLKRGDHVMAKRKVAEGMNDEDWAAYRDATTKKLAKIANRRAALYASLSKLGVKAAKMIGAAVTGALGL